MAHVVNDGIPLTLMSLQTKLIKKCNLINSIFSLLYSVCVCLRTLPKSWLWFINICKMPFLEISKCEMVNSFGENPHSVKLQRKIKKGRSNM
jgi:hypothetical protein